MALLAVAAGRPSLMRGLLSSARRRATRSCSLLIVLVAAVVGLAALAQAQTNTRAALRLQGGGTIRALVVGIDQYPYLRAQDQLSGAAADARDIADTLARVGVSDLTVLLDTHATRAAFTQAMELLVGNASSGDLVMITFAGHGSQEKERVPGSKPNGMYEAFILSLIAGRGPGTRERIIDEEIFDWLKQLGKKGAEIIFVADSCHGGGMTKAASRGGLRTGVRGITRVYDPGEAGPGSLYIAPENDELAVPASTTSDNATRDVPSLTFLAGVDAQSEVMEIAIDGHHRGALSYAFARTLESPGFGGDITREKLFKSVHQQVLQLTEQRQSPVMEPRTRDAAQRVLFQKPGGGTEETPLNAPLPDVGIVTLDGGATAPAPPGLNAFWDRKTGDVISETRAVLAYGVAQNALPAVAARVGVTAALARMAARIPLQVSLLPRQSIFAEGQKFQLVIDGVYGRYLLMVNLAGNGEVQYLFPSGNANPLIMNDHLVVPMHASQPFGVDTMIVLASTQRKTDLELELSLLDRKAKPRELLRALQGRLEGADYLGIISYGTRP